MKGQCTLRGFKAGSGQSSNTFSRIVPEIGIEWRTVSYRLSRVVPTSFTILLGWKTSLYATGEGEEGENRVKRKGKRGGKGK